MKIWFYFLIMIKNILAQQSFQPVGKVIFIDSKLRFEKGYSVEKPPQSYKVLVKWKRDNKVSCLIYKIPFQNKSLGTLFYRDFEKGRCVLGDLKEKEILFSEITSLKLRNIQLRKNPRFEIAMNRKKKKKEEVIKVYLPFYSERYSRWRGLEVFEKKTKEMIPDGELCMTYDKNCNLAKEKSCKSCESSSWSSFSNLKCPSKTFGICGVNQCGGKKQNACLKMNTFVTKLDCELAQKYFYCQHGLTIYCQKNGDIICD